jgi:hypothetical protein
MKARWSPTSRSSPTSVSAATSTVAVALLGCSGSPSSPTARYSSSKALMRRSASKIGWRASTTSVTAS